jgi:hypothetical protein
MVRHSREVPMLCVPDHHVFLSALKVFSVSMKITLFANPFLSKGMLAVTQSV